MKPFRNSLLIAGAFLLQLASASFILTQNDQGAQIACCPQGNDPASPDCCDAKHHQPGSDKASYRCCSLEQFAKSVVCGNLGKIMVDGECVCPSNMIEDASGICQVATPAPSCESGLHEGKCYLFQLINGLFGPDGTGQYDVVDESRKFGKFKFCKTEACSGRSPINPNDEFRIYDVIGDGLTDESFGLWVNWPANTPDGRIGTTETWGKASKFSISRWTDGQYCLSRVHNTFVNQQCFPLWVVEVPCDIHALENNCIGNYPRKIVDEVPTTKKAIERLDLEEQLYGRKIGNRYSMAEDSIDLFAWKMIIRLEMVVYLVVLLLMIRCFSPNQRW